MVTLLINGERQAFPEPLTVADLVRRLAKDAKALAVEVNRDVVPLAEHDRRVLEDGDEIEIVTLVGGG